jgi:hypothetical protein
MNTCSTHEYTMTPAQLLKQESSNQGDLDLNVNSGAWESLLHEDGPASDFIFVPWYVIVVGLYSMWHTLHYGIVS